MALSLFAFTSCSGAHPGKSVAKEHAALDELRVCADPNNLPFSNDRGDGFEIAIAKVIASDLGVPATFTWLPQRRGFIRNTLKARDCDVVMSEPTGFDMAHVTRPYYRSSYAFVTRADRDLANLRTFDDPRLRNLRVGVHAIGDDYANVPPAMALAKRGLSDHIVGYSIYGDYSQPDPPRNLIDAVANCDVDVAIVWGPIGGYFAKHASVPMVVTPVESNDPGMAFDLGLAVRKDDKQFARKLEDVLAREQPRIDHILDDYGVPHLALANAPAIFDRL